MLLLILICKIHAYYVLAATFVGGARVFAGMEQRRLDELIQY